MLARHAGVAGHIGVSAVPAVLLTGAAAIALFALCGYPVARLLVAGEFAPARALVALPLGATVSGLALAALGLLHVPLKVSLAALIAVAVAANAWVLLRPRAHSSSDAESDIGPGTPWLVRVGVPLAVAGIVACIALVPIFRSGYATVPGQNGDAILVVGTAVLLEHHPPTATGVTSTPIPGIPLEWRSKYPIYYPLAAVATLAGQDPITAFPTVAALMLALAALGFFLFARYVLRAPPWVGLLVLFVLPLDRIAIYVVDHPYYNELWGQFALPFMLLFGWRYLTSPDRRTAALFVLFGVLCLLAYPLVIPFPAIFLLAGAVAVWRRRRKAGEPVGWIAGLRLPRPGRAWVWVPILVVLVPAAFVLGRGFVEKTGTALQVILPGSNLQGWSGSALPFLPFPEFVGMPSSALLDELGLALVCLLAAVGLTRVRAEARWAVGTMVVATALIGVYFRNRTDGELFFFKDLAFAGPYVLMLALVALGWLATSRARRLAAVGLVGVVAALLAIPWGAEREIERTFPQANHYVMQIRTWNRELPRGSSVLVDIEPSGWQLWASYMLTDHPLSTPNPLDGIFPHPAIGTKADYLIAMRPQLPPRWAIVGAPVFSNAQFVVWHMNQRLRWPDVSARPLIYDLSHITIA